MCATSSFIKCHFQLNHTFHFYETDSTQLVSSAYDPLNLLVIMKQADGTAKSLTMLSRACHTETGNHAVSEKNIRGRIAVIRMSICSVKGKHTAL